MTTVLHVLTPTIVGREILLGECVESVRAQIPVPGVEIRHYVLLDVERNGPAVIRNELARMVPDDDWICFLDDDDLWMPHHVKTLAPRLPEGDVVYTLANITGRDGWDPQQPTFDPERLRQVNFIPLCGVAVKAERFNAVGGFTTSRRILYEDYHLFLDLLNSGSEFVCVAEKTWEYRFGDWDSRSKEIWRGERKGRA